MKIASLADVERIEQVPIDAQNWARNTFELISRAAARHGDAPALTWLPNAADLASTQQWSFSELRSEVVRAANMFHALGCGTDDAIAYLLPNLPQAHFALWGAEATGIAVAINPALSGDMIVALLKSMSVKVLVVDASVLPDAVRGELEAAELPELRAIVQIGAVPLYNRGAVSVDFANMSRIQPADRLLSGRVISERDRSSAFCTGGTTGAPKIAIRTHASEAVNAHMVAMWFEEMIGPGDTLFCGLPLFHVNAVLVTGTMPWLHGAHVLLGPASGYRDQALIENFWRIVERFGVTLFSGVPTLYSRLLDVPIAGADLSSLKLGICGAAPMPIELFRRFEETTGVRIIEGYGLTESSCAASMNPPFGERRVGSIGLRLPYERMRIATVVDGKAREAETGEVGVVAIEGPNVFQGYADPVHDASAWLDFGDGKRWLDTGDLGRVDDEGYFWLTGRKKELIIRGGHNIDPRVIEEALHTHPAIALAAAVARPDRHAGEVPVAYVQLRDGAEATPETLLRFAQDHIGERAAVPKEVMILERLPMTAVGKLFKPDLVQREREQTVQREAEQVGTQVIGLECVRDADRGPVIRVSVSAKADALRQRLGDYAFAVDIREVQPAS